MTRPLPALLLVFGLLLGGRTYSQSNSDSLIFIKLGSVYRSNLIEFNTSGLLMLKFKTIPAEYTYDDIFCNLSKGVFKSSRSINDNAIIDSLSKLFHLYKVEFNQTPGGRRADSLLTRSNYYVGYLVRLQEDRGVVTHYILQRWRSKFSYVQYQVTNFDCNENNQGCVVKIESIR